MYYYSLISWICQLFRYRIGPCEVEAALERNEHVAECAVVSSPDLIRGAVPKAFVVLRDKDKLCMSEAEFARILLEHVKKHVAPYKYPRKVKLNMLYANAFEL